MHRSRFLHGALGASLLLAACGGDDGQPVDAAPGGPCWPLDAKPGGQVELGTGDLTFMPMPDVLSFISNGSQSDPYLQVHSRIRGLPPGDANDILDPHNPKTKVSAFIGELNLTLGVECPASLGYMASDEAGVFDMVHSLRIGLGTLPYEQVSGKQARITIEVVGNGLYAMDSKMVTLMTPFSAPSPEPGP